MVVGVEVVGCAGVAHELRARERTADQRGRRIADLDRWEGGSAGHHSVIRLPVSTRVRRATCTFSPFLFGDAHDAVLRREDVAGHDRREILELLFAVHDVAPVRDLERVGRSPRLIKKRAQQRRRRNDAGEARLGGR